MKNNNSIDDKVITLEYTLQIPIWIDDVVGKDESEITEQEWKQWFSLEDEYEVLEQHHDFRIDHGSYEHKKFVESFKYHELGGGLVDE